TILGILLLTQNLFLSGLCYDTNEPILKQAFEQHGETIEVKVICDHKSGKSKGYGFVKFTSETAASKALKEMDGQFLFFMFLSYWMEEIFASVMPTKDDVERFQLSSFLILFVDPVHIPQLFAMDSRRSMQAFQITGILPEVKSGLLGRS
uniref:Glycine-rich RNA-binding protein n=1 Tax=Solanum tuberosum TaxID=4113 RepID=M1CLP6_SOLTU